MSASENNRIKPNSGRATRKGFDRKRKRSNILDENEKQKIISHYAPLNKKTGDDNQQKKESKGFIDFSKLFHNKTQNPSNVNQEPENEKKGFEVYLEEYEKLRGDYESGVMSQSSILLLQRRAKEINENPQYPNINQIPVLQELLHISK